MEHLVIIGNGISGITLARHVRKNSKMRITVVSAESDYFFSRTALMYVYMGHMKFEHTQPYENNFWRKNKIELVNDFVEGVDVSKKQLHLKKGGTHGYDKLVIASGSKSNKFGWPGQDLKGVQGLYSKQDLELLEENSNNAVRAVIVGGGLIGVELAEMLASRGIKVTFLVREKRFWGNVLPKEEGALISKHILNDHYIDLRFENNLKEIISDDNGRVKSIIIEETGEEISCQIVGLTAGVSPNIDFLKDSSIELQRGVMVNRYLETNIPDVYALGDCAQFHEAAPGRRPIEQVWYTGRMMGETLAKTLTGDKTMYEPGYWFNSAKFFDIEYQTYGTVLGELQEGQQQFYWEHPEGRICFKMVFNASNKRVVGVNVFGIRMRHHVWDKWLQEGRDANYVMEHLRDANFDPEFYKLYETDIVSLYNSETGENIKPKKKSWKRMLQALNR
ncbi:MAG: NAD(P)H-nitrite reductase large subunit [Flavobacteriales bacterium]|jgi:NAD(P)H-nitrite reductase large subunit